MGIRNNKSRKTMEAQMKREEKDRGIPHFNPTTVLQKKRKNYIGNVDI